MERNLAEDLLSPKTTIQEPESSEIKEDAEVRCMRRKVDGLGELVRKGDDDSSSSNAETEAPVDSHPLDSCVEFSRNEEQQTPWGRHLPEHILRQIIQYVVKGEGSLPALFRIGGVCTLWRRVSKSPIFWVDVDLSCIKRHQRTVETLRWLVYNRLKMCQRLKLSNWDLPNAPSVLSELASASPELTDLDLSNGSVFECSILRFLLERFGKLERIDFSKINLGAMFYYFCVWPLCYTLKDTRTKLTHINLSNNEISDIQDVVSCLAKYCPNLVVLDLSNIRGKLCPFFYIRIEELQVGCPKLKALRTSYSPLHFPRATQREIETAPGFKELEELSVVAPVSHNYYNGGILTDSCLLRIIGKSPKLKLLTVGRYEEITHTSLLQLPATDLEHLSIIGCAVTDRFGTTLPLVADKWAHSLTDLDLSGAKLQEPINNALKVLAEKGPASPLEKLILYRSAVTDEPVKEILANCPLLNFINTIACENMSHDLITLADCLDEVNNLRDYLQIPLKYQSSLKRGEKYKPNKF